MKRNIGNVDRILRWTIAAIITMLFATGILHGTIGIVLIVIAGILVVTSLAGFCPLYKLIGFNSCPVKS